MKILAVDDNPNVLELIKLILHVHGHDIKTEQNGKNAIEAFLSEPFDLVLTDIAMAGMDGNELAGFLKASVPHVPVIAVTGEIEKASTAFDRVISKPFFTRDLVQTINEFSH